MVLDNRLCSVKHRFRLPKVVFISFLDLEEAFSLFDIDGNGQITLNELIAVLRSLGKDFSDEDVKEMLDIADKDGI